MVTVLPGLTTVLPGLHSVVYGAFTGSSIKIVYDCTRVKFQMKNNTILERRFFFVAEFLFDCQLTLQSKVRAKFFDKLCLNANLMADIRRATMHYNLTTELLVRNEVPNDQSWNLSLCHNWKFPGTRISKLVHPVLLRPFMFMRPYNCQSEIQSTVKGKKPLVRGNFFQIFNRY